MEEDEDAGEEDEAFVAAAQRQRRCLELNKADVAPVLTVDERWPTVVRDE